RRSSDGPGRRVPRDRSRDLAHDQHFHPGPRRLLRLSPAHRAYVEEISPGRVGVFVEEEETGGARRADAQQRLRYLTRILSRFSRGPLPGPLLAGLEDRSPTVRLVAESLGMVATRRRCATWTSWRTTRTNP